MWGEAQPRRRREDPRPGSGSDPGPKLRAPTQNAFRVGSRLRCERLQRVVGQLLLWSSITKRSRPSDRGSDIIIMNPQPRNGVRNLGVTQPGLVPSAVES